MNPLDQKLRDFNVLNVALPAILGHDLVGTVVKNGPNTSSFPVCSHVFSQCSSMTTAGLQEYAIVKAPYTAIVPAGLSDEDAAVFPINAFTSTVSMFHPEKGLAFPFPGTAESKTFDYKSQTLVIIGGGTNCGKLAIQNRNDHRHGFALW